MFVILALLKWILVLGLLAAGVVFLLTGVGVEIPVVKYKGVEAYGLPAGVILLAAGVALARFWPLQSTETTETTTSSGGSKSTTSTTTTKTTTIKTLTKGPD